MIARALQPDAGCCRAEVASPADGVGMRFHGEHAVAPPGKLDGVFKLPHRSLVVALLFQRLGQVTCGPRQTQDPARGRSGSA